MKSDEKDDDNNQKANVFDIVHLARWIEMME